MMEQDLRAVPGFLFFDHVAIAVVPGDLDAQVAAYKTLGFTEVHREDVLGSDNVREVLLRVGEGPNLVQLIEPLSADSPVARQIAVGKHDHLLDVLGYFKIAQSRSGKRRPCRFPKTAVTSDRGPAPSRPACATRWPVRPG